MKLHGLSKQYWSANRYNSVKTADFERFYLDSRDVCFRAVLASVKNSDQAFDLLSTAYERALSNWSELLAHPNKNAWVVKTALNLHKDEIRHRTNRRRFLFANSASYEQKLEGIDHSLLKRIRELPEQQRYVIAYRIFLDLSVEETAKLMEIAPSTVSVHLSRALSTLRIQLEENEWREENAQ